MPRVKGLAFRSVLSALEALEGPEVLSRVREHLPPNTGRTLAALTANAWYPLEAYSDLWASIQSVTGNRRDLPRAIGFRATELDLTLIHHMAFAALSVSTVITISTRLFNMYYDTGRARCAMVSARRIRVTLSGCEGFTEWMWTEVRGGVECFAAKASKSRASSVLVSGGTDGSPDCVIDVYWLARGDEPPSDAPSKA